MSNRKKRKQCNKKICRRLCTDENTKYCVMHLQEEIEKDPFYGLKRLTEIEAEKWGRLDAEIRNIKLSQQLKILEIQVEQLQEEKRQEKYRLLQNQKQQELQSLNKVLIISNVEYSKLTVDLAKKYSIEKYKMIIDPDTRLIREH